MSNRPVRPTAGRSAAPGAEAPSRPIRGAAAAATAPAGGVAAAVRRGRAPSAPAAKGSEGSAPSERALKGAAAPAEAPVGRPVGRAAARAAVAAATPESATKAAESEADKPRDMVTAVEELAILLRSENESLRRHELDQVRENIERKQQLTRAYMQQMIAFKKNPKLVETLSPERHRDLKACIEVLQPLIEDNGRMLKAKIESINRFMGVVVEAVRDQKSKGAVVYGTGGAMDESHADHRHMAVAVNQEL